MSWEMADSIRGALIPSKHFWTALLCILYLYSSSEEYESRSFYKLASNKCSFSFEGWSLEWPCEASIAVEALQMLHRKSIREYFYLSSQGGFPREASAKLKLQDAGYLLPFSTMSRSKAGGGDAISDIQQVAPAFIRLQHC